MQKLEKSLISRRSSLALLASAVAAPSFAMSTSGAESFVSKATKELESIVNSGATGGSLHSKVAAFFRKYADVSSIARAVIGAPWRGMSAAQQKGYVGAFEKYVARKYGDQLHQIKGGKSHIARSTDKGASGVRVDVEYNWPGYNPRTVEFLVSDGGGSPKVLDMKVLGISLLSTERIFVRQALTHSNNDIDKLIVKLSK